MRYLQERHAAGEIVTGLLYLDPAASDIHVHLNTVHAPLNQLGETELCPGAAKLGAINASYRP
jgi:2-oxoglutarate ferredoxin oxidoreductase subunit beta